MQPKNKSDAKKEEEDLTNREFLKGKDLSAQTRIGRPPVLQMDDQKDAMEFMQIDCDYYTERPKRVVEQGKCISGPSNPLLDQFISKCV